MKSIGTCILCSLLLHANVIAQSFVNVAQELGIQASYQSFDNFGNGMSFFDFDGDGWDDLTYARENNTIVVYRNNGGQAELFSLNIPTTGITKQVLWFDYDNDGANDLLISNYNGWFYLYRNTGDFVFEDVTAESGIVQSIATNYGLAVGDYDRDGWLDFFVSRYEYPSVPNSPWLHNQLFRNNGDGTFDNVSVSAGLTGSMATTFDAVWMDYNRDGWPDLYVINDRTNFNNELYHNNGDGTFTELAQEVGAHFEGGFPMTATVADHDNDEDLDIYMTSVGGLYHTHFLVNDGTGQYVESADEQGVISNVFTWGALFADYNNNGLQDLFVAASPIGSGQPLFKDLFFEQTAEGSFTMNQGLFEGLAHERTYTPARGDWNNDGFYEIATHTISPFEQKLWLNQGNTNNYIKISLQGTVSNSMAIGSWIKVYANGKVYTQYTMCGENYVGQNSQHHIFGLGNASSVDSVRVEYNRGHVDTYYNLLANQHYYFTEGETFQPAIAALNGLSVCEGDTIVLDAGDFQNFLWSDGSDERYLHVTEPGQYWVEVTNDFSVTGFSDTVNVVVNPLPIIEPGVFNPLCNGDDNGEVWVSNLLGTASQSVIWNNGLAGDTIQGLSEGLYSYVFTDIHNCSASGDVLLNEPLPLVAMVFVYPEVSGNDGGLNILINGGTPPYDISLDGTSIPLVVDTLSAGIYQLLITDQNGCIYETEVIIGTLVGEYDDFNKTGWVYPNPIRSGDQLFFNRNGLQGNLEVSIFNNIGALVLNTHLFDGVGFIDLPALDAGNYQLVISSPHNRVSLHQKLVVR